MLIRDKMMYLDDAAPSDAAEVHDADMGACRHPDGTGVSAGASKPRRLCSAESNA